MLVVGHPAGANKSLLVHKSLLFYGTFGARSSGRGAVPRSCDPVVHASGAITRFWTSRRSNAVTLARVRARSSEHELDAWGPLVNVKRDGVGGYACGQQAAVVDGWPVRDDVAAAAYAASSLLASAASKSGDAQVAGKK